jgi:pimeloyl-ACP methyl ester carboxylesterase
MAPAPSTEHRGRDARRRAVAWLLSLVLVGAAGCTGDDRASSTLPNPDISVGPDVPEFYSAAGPSTDARPGDLIWARPLDAPDGARGYAILYWSTTVDGSLVPVSGVLFEPDEPASRTRPVLAWAHGPFGLGDACAPSQDFFRGEGPSLPIALQAIEEDAMFVASDFAGLGTPGEHPYLVNEIAGRNVLDSIRAAARFTRTEPDAVIVGQSQGGSAALRAAELQPAYAPEVGLRATVAVSAPSNASLVDGRLAGGPYSGYLLMIVHGYRAAYPELAAVALGEAGRTALQTSSTECLSEILRRYAQQEESELGLADILDNPDFQRRLADNEPGRQPPATPVLLVHGGLDDIIPAQEVDALADRYCQAGVEAEVQEYPESGHVDVIVAALDDIVDFMNERVAGEPMVAIC